MAIVYLALGSNINPRENFSECARSIRSRWNDVTFSCVFRSGAREVEEQDDFFNAAARVVTKDSPREFSKKLRNIEVELKKSPAFRFGPRTIDLDILLYDDQVLPTRERWTTDQQSDVSQQTADLYVPHLRMHERAFVLAPLSQLMDFTNHHPVFDREWRDFHQQVENQACVEIDFVL